MKVFLMKDQNKMLLLKTHYNYSFEYLIINGDRFTNLKLYIITISITIIIYFHKL